MASAIVLAGGRSRRFGRDKASTLLAGRPLLQHVIERVASLAEETIVVTRRGQVLPPLDTVTFRRVDDLYADRGPLGGLYSGLTATKSFPALAVACDMPLLQPALLEALASQQAGYDAAVPLRQGLPEGLCAAYGPSCVAAIEARLQRQELKLGALFADLKTRYLKEGEWRALDPEGLSFLNLNTEADLAMVASRLNTN